MKTNFNTGMQIYPVLFFLNGCYRTVQESDSYSISGTGMFSAAKTDYLENNYKLWGLC